MYQMVNLLHEDKLICTKVHTIVTKLNNDNNDMKHLKDRFRMKFKANLILLIFDQAVF